MYLKEKNNIMKRFIYLLLLCLGVPFCMFSQTSEEKAFNMYQQVENIAYDVIASFCQFPAEHKNTTKVFDKLKQLQGTLRDINSSPAPKGARILSDKYKNLAFQVDCFIDLLRTICGYSTILKEDQMHFLTGILKGMGWTEKMLGVECEHAYFVEYQHGNFKMMFIKNTLTEKEDDYYSMSNSRNMIEVNFIYDYYNTGGTYNVAAGKYRMIQYKDNVSSNYHKIIKATTKLIH